MAEERSSAEESQPWTEAPSAIRISNVSPDHRESTSSASTTSLLFEHFNGSGHPPKNEFDTYKDSDEQYKENFQELDIEDGPPYEDVGVDPKYRRYLYIVGVLCALSWGLALAFFIFTGTYKHRSTLEHNPDATGLMGAGAGKKVTIDQLQTGEWYARSHGISWIAGPHGEDGLLLERGGGAGKPYLVVEDIRSWEEESKATAMDTITLMKMNGFQANSEYIAPDLVWPSADLKKILVLSNRRKNWRHSYTGRYWIFDVASQTAEALDTSDPQSRMQLATWSPTSDAVVFTRDNNMFLRKVDADVTSPRVTQITLDGGEEMFNGVPDWVYEEEVFEGNTATWWSEDGKFIAFLATNETGVPEYPVEFFISRPSLTEPKPGLESYPEVQQIKYPKAGAPNPVVHLRFYDVEAKAVFNVPIEDDFPDEDRLITEVIWAGQHGHVLIRQTNRESDFLKMVLIDVTARTGKIVRSQDVKALDGGWFEISETTTFIPSDAANGRKDDGYVDTVIYQGYDHLAYFTPLDNPEPKLLTSGKWEVVRAPSAVDLKRNMVYFVGTKEGSTQRHVYKVELDGSTIDPVSDTSKDGYYGVSFSKGAGFALLSYQGPRIPWQKVISTPSNSMSYEHIVEENKELALRASEHELPTKTYSTVIIDDVKLNVVERRPVHFDSSKMYPVLFYLYGGPGSQTVDKRFDVDFQSYVASNLGYIVVTVDGRGTGLIGRKARTIIRGNLGYWEAHDQIATAKIWGEKSYVDKSRMAIWGWSYGGYMTLKTLEQDAGQTFRYGMAVAPVTDWRFYDSVYTERWMYTPQHNPEGYKNASVNNVTAIGQNTRFLLIHGIADDNVHMQNSLVLLDKLDLAGVENYDVHVFPDSDHGIYFHNANRMVYDKLSWWLINAMNGEWAKIAQAVPLRVGVQVGTGE